MLCAIYKSSKKVDTYLYLPKRNDFSAVPDALLSAFGKSTLVTVMMLTETTFLAHASTIKVITALTEQGFYLQLPPPIENLLTQHKHNLGL